MRRHRIRALAGRKIVGWAMRDHMRTDLPLAALMMASSGNDQRAVSSATQIAGRNMQLVRISTTWQ